MYKTFLLLCLSAVVLPASAQTKPSASPGLADTKRFVVEMLKSCHEVRTMPNGSNLNLKMVEVNTDLHDADLEFITMSEVTRDPGKIVLWSTQKVRLADLDPQPRFSKGEDGDPMVSFDCAKGTCVESKSSGDMYNRGKHVTSTSTTTSQSPSLGFPVCVRDTERFGRAFSHLITLHGGQTGLFK